MNRIIGNFKNSLKFNVRKDFASYKLPRFIINSTKVFFFLHFFNEYIGSVRATAGPSMLPTLNLQDDVVYVSKFYRRGKGVKVGDVVTLKHPMFPGVSAAKRVLGMPGDFVLKDTPGSGTGMMIQVGSDRR